MVSGPFLEKLRRAAKLRAGRFSLTIVAAATVIVPAGPLPVGQWTGILEETAADSSTPEEPRMPLYLSKFSYTPESWARLIGNPEDRREAARTYIESVGGSLHGFWYAFGSHDGYTLWEAPDNVSMAAVAMALSGGGALSSLDTTVLLTVDETLTALRRAAEVRYRPPGA
jgi:uncharacterized protein with GYD domain